MAHINILKPLTSTPIKNSGVIEPKLRHWIAFLKP